MAKSLPTYFAPPVMHPTFLPRQSSLLPSTTRPELNGKTSKNFDRGREINSLPQQLQFTSSLNPSQFTAQSTTQRIPTMRVLLCISSNHSIHRHQFTTYYHTTIFLLLFTPSVSSSPSSMLSLPKSINN
ncbi:hypothetical protein M0R45_021487 [Rubus argutus]|uniref:Uncharacterized protein n=1 Tax=Rubus argutus TaxID=59490 RepID=A0AAW1XCS5_RUBAR